MPTVSRKQRKPTHRYRVSLLGRSLMKFIGFVDASDERSAEEAAAPEVPANLRFKLIAQREDLYPPSPARGYSYALHPYVYERPSSNVTSTTA